MAAAAAASSPAPALRLVPKTTEAPTTRRGEAVQGSLFGLQEVSKKATAVREARHSQAPRPKREKVEQSKLDFDAPAIRSLGTSVASALYSSAPVAESSFRSMAAIIDTAIGLLGTILFMGIFRAAGFQFDLSRQSLISLGVATILISMLYRALYALAGGDTLGLRMMNLRLVDFCGHLPSRKERLQRLFGGLVSFFSLGMGLIWAMADEDKLTWHDHISKTYPTSFERER